MLQVLRKLCGSLLLRSSFLLTMLLLTYPLRGQEPSSSDSLLQRYEELIEASFAAGNAGDYPRAERLLREAIHLQPKSPANVLLFNNLGGLQQLQGKQDAALLSYSAALELAPNEGSSRFNRARLYTERKEYKAALTDFALLVASHPNNELYRYQRAMVYLLVKDYDLAALDLKQIIEKNASSLKARIGLALVETMQGHYEEAERLYGYLTDKLPRNAEVMEGRARLFLARGMKGFAQRDINLAFEYAGGKVPASLYRLRAELERSLGQDKQALADEQRATELERRQR